MGWNDKHNFHVLRTQCTRHLSNPEPTCLSCGMAASQESHALEKSTLATLDHVLAAEGLQRVEIPRDGYCLINAWLKSMSLRSIQTTSLRQCLEDVKTEILSHLECYGSFLGDCDVCSELDAYCDGGDYAADTVDLVIYALATIHRAVCCVVSLTSQGALSHRLISPLRSGPREGRNLAVVYIREFQHYDALVKISGISSPLTYWVPDKANILEPLPGSRYMKRSAFHMHTCFLNCFLA